MRKKCRWWGILPAARRWLFFYKNRETIHKNLKAMGIDLPEIFREQSTKIREGVEYAKKGIQGKDTLLFALTY